MAKKKDSTFSPGSAHWRRCRPLVRCLPRDLGCYDSNCASPGQKRGSRPGASAAACPPAFFDRTPKLTAAAGCQRLVRSFAHPTRPAPCRQTWSASSAGRGARAGRGAGQLLLAAWQAKRRFSASPQFFNTHQPPPRGAAAGVADRRRSGAGRAALGGRGKGKGQNAKKKKESVSGLQLSRKKQDNHPRFFVAP